jgi:eukaryotic-like serine/threonine-protein kinase
MSELPKGETATAVNSPVLTLTVAEGPQRGQTVLCVGAGKVRVGRSARAHLQLSDPHVSRAQFLIENGPTGWRVMDFGSKNRTHLDDRPLEPNRPADLGDGDRIRAGQTTLVVSLTPPAGIDEHDTWVLPAKSEPLPEQDWPDTLGPTQPWHPADGSSVSTLSPSPTAFTPQPPHPERLGAYRIERELGRGGMGVVYLAVRESDETRVALKTIIPAVKYAPGQIQRFLREANILRDLTHHHIVPFLEAGEAEGTLFLAMGYVEGTDASRMVAQQGPLPVKTAIRMICQLLSALEYAHEKGFVHRDIKPGNLLVADESGKKSVKLADFGLARVYQDSRLSGLTLEGDIGGSIAFMAPEQITGFRQTKPAADQYSAAATLYTLISGKSIFDFERGQDQLKTVLENTPTPILQRCPDLSPDLAGIIHRALAKDPLQRHPDVRSFRALLKAFA